MKRLGLQSYFIAALGLAICVALIAPRVSLAEETPQPPRHEVKDKEVSQTPVVTLQRWQNAQENERYSFLVGFATMMEIERSWQGEKPLPYKQSLIGCWYEGLKGMTYKELYDRIEAYIAAHPGDMDLPLPRVIWFEVVQPKVAAKIKTEK